MVVITCLLLSLLTVNTVTGDSQFEDLELSEVRRSGNVQEGTCGIPAIPPSGSVRIVGGVEAVPHSWPWTVSLQTNDGFHFCGGCLINNQWVLSAGHCVIGCKPGLQTTAVIGLHRHSQPDNFTVRIPMSQCIVHPKYNRAGHQLHNNDIMLVKLAHPVEFNDAVSPVCLPTTLFQKLPHGKRCYSSGWGRLWTGGDTPDELMQAMMPLVDNDVCYSRYPTVGLEDCIVCAGDEDSGRICQGDSGGPLVCLEDDHWMLYGIVSMSYRVCGDSYHPSIYARTSAYIDWISKTIDENSD